MLAEPKGRVLSFGGAVAHSDQDPDRGLFATEQPQLPIASI